jgi:hypothetical protein
MDIARVLGLSEQDCIDLNLTISTSILKASVALFLLLLGFAALPVMMNILINDWMLDRELVRFALPMMLTVWWGVVVSFGMLPSLFMSFVPVNGIKHRDESIVLLVNVLCLGVLSNAQVIGFVHSDLSLAVSAVLSIWAIYNQFSMWVCKRAIYQGVTV